MALLSRWTTKRTAASFLSFFQHLTAQSIVRAAYFSSSSNAPPAPSCSQSSSPTTPLVPPPTKLLAFRSLSLDIFENLAFEEWLLENQPLSECSVLLMYRSSPTIVIGRNQNIWTECNLQALREAGVTLARRKSGGGAVYHDLGNLNVAFLDSRARHNKCRNVKIVSHALNEGWSLASYVSKRGDIFIGETKISGSAYVLNPKTALHHMTLLYDADLEGLRALLLPTRPQMKNFGLHSVRSPVANLCDFNPVINESSLVYQIGAKFQEEYSFSVVDVIDVYPKQIADLKKLMHNLQSWDWMYGNNPKTEEALSYSLPWTQIDVLCRTRLGKILEFNASLNNVQLTDEDEVSQLKAILDKFNSAVIETRFEQGVLVDLVRAYIRPPNNNEAINGGRMPTTQADRYRLDIANTLIRFFTENPI